jgi:hypothetical protein
VNIDKEVSDGLKKSLSILTPALTTQWQLWTALHSPDLEVLGLTTVFGNTEVELCSLNALRLVELEGNDHIPVAQGCGQPLVHNINSFSAGVHGKDGLGNTNLPLPMASLIQPRCPVHYRYRHGKPPQGYPCPDWSVDQHCLASGWSPHCPIG